MKVNKTKVIVGLATLASTIIFTGCGGSSSAKKVAKAYYVDSSVEGVNYKCGSQIGKTKEDGSFNFEVNQNCEFYIGNYKFKEIASSNLKDGAIIVEDDTKIATILQTLDNDGDATNGIKISENVANCASEILIKEHENIHTNINSVLDNVDIAINSHPKAKEEYHGHIVDEESAITHLEKTKEDLLILRGK